MTLVRELLFGVGWSSILAPRPSAPPCAFVRESLAAHAKESFVWRRFGGLDKGI